MVLAAVPTTASPEGIYICRKYLSLNGLLAGLIPRYTCCLFYNIRYDLQNCSLICGYFPIKLLQLHLMLPVSHKGYKQCFLKRTEINEKHLLKFKNIKKQNWFCFLERYGKYKKNP